MRGPTSPISQLIQAEKHRLEGEDFEEACTRRANALKDDDIHFRQYRDILLDMKFLEGGRIQTAAGAPREVTMFNCFVSPTIEDSLDSIMTVAHKAAKTMKMGGGIGYSFSGLRPRGDGITTLDSKSCGPLGFMQIFDSVCNTIASAGHRRGAQMAVLRVDHPDILEFIAAKQNTHNLRNFNISVGITNEYMACLETGTRFPLRFNGRIYRTVDAGMLWEKIMRSTWEWAEPGVIFIDRVNEMNNLHYCETIEATNPCGEQPLPPNGACLLGSINLTKFVLNMGGWFRFDWDELRRVCHVAYRAMDNVIDRSIYPLPEYQAEATRKRRMGIGITGLANTIEALGMPYGTPDAQKWTEEVMRTITAELYWASASRAESHGAFPMCDPAMLRQSAFVRQFEYHPDMYQILAKIEKSGLRNSHLTSIAPTGTISFAADNVSSGVEPPYALEYDRTQRTWDGEVVHRVKDYAWDKWGKRGRTATEVTALEHVQMLCAAQKWTDSAVSKTCNVNPKMPWAEFKEVYKYAFEHGAKGCTTFNPGGKRFGILKEVIQDTPAEGAACYIDPDTGERSCG